MLAVLVLLDLARLRTPLADRGVLDGDAGTLMSWTLVPTVALVLATGLILAVRSPWGLTRYWWLLAKCALAAALTGAGLILMLTGAHSVGVRCAAVVALLTATVLSVVKPWGRTPFVAAPGRHRPAQ